MENLGDSKIVIRKASRQVLKELLLHTDSVGLVTGTYLRRGLENDDWRVRHESVQSLCSLLDAVASSHVDAQLVLSALVARLRDPSMIVVQAAQESLFSLQAILERIPYVRR